MQDRSSTPHRQPTATPAEVVSIIEQLRRTRKWSAARIAFELNRILAEEFLYAKTWTCESQRANALGVWNIHYNYHRPHSAARGRPPASQLPAGVTNVMASYN